MKSEKETTKKKSSMSSFFTLSAAEEGVRIELDDPSGKPSGEFMTIRGTESAVFQAAGRASILRHVKTAAKLEAFLESKPSKAKSEERLAEHDIEDQMNDCWLIAHLIKDWTFEEELTIESAQEFLFNTPYVERKINQFAAKRGEFTSANFEKPPQKS